MASYSPPPPGRNSAATALASLESQIDAIEAELGTNPSGTYTDVATRLAAIEAGVGGGGSPGTWAEQTGTWADQAGTWADQ